MLLSSKLEICRQFFTAGGCNVHQLCALLNQGKHCNDMGRAKWAEANYELALERYTMGVGMLEAG